MNLERIKGTLIPVWYHVHRRHPAPPDAAGYVPEDKLLPVTDQYIDYDSEDLALLPGYTQATIAEGRERGEVYIVRNDDIYTPVERMDGIAGGLAVPTPGGGWTALAGRPTHEDSEGNLYVRNYW